MGKNRNGIPERWEDYGFISKQIPGTRFVAFKVPLKAALLKYLDSSVASFDVNLLMEYCPKLGLVVDLTNTDRYYDSAEIRHHKVSYCKLKTMGHVVPANHIYFKFFRAAEDFLTTNKNNEKLIGVHCTHGVNRTGYLIIRYMIQHLKIKPEEAISTFNSARGHAVERENYLMDLRKATWPIPPKLTSNNVQTNTPRNLQGGNSGYGDGSNTFYRRKDASLSYYKNKYDPYQRPIRHEPSYGTHHSNYVGHSSSQFVKQQYSNSGYDHFRDSEREVRGPNRKYSCSGPNELPETSRRSHSYELKDCIDYTDNNNLIMSSSFESHPRQNMSGPSSSSHAYSYHKNINDRNTSEVDRKSRDSSYSYHEDCANSYFQKDKSTRPQLSSNSESFVYSQRKFPNFNSPKTKRPYRSSWLDKSVYSWKA